MKRSLASVTDNELPDKALKTDRLCINEMILSDECKKSVAENWKTRKDFSSDSCQLVQDPFCHCILTEFLQETDSGIKRLQEEIIDVEYTEKDNDLYKFHQSKQDLKTADTPEIKNLRSLLCSTFRDWLIEVCDMPLNDNVSMFCAKYMHTDMLLCHDDELEGRRIAFIYYLVSPSWVEKDGGCLDLFAVDDNIQPTEVVKSIVPRRNSLVFFEVSPGSYHQVAEVLSEDKIRWSIGGWFHGPPIERPHPYMEPARPLVPYGSVEDDVFFEWINPVYLTPHAQGSIQEQFETESEIELQTFLQEDKFNALLKTLKSPERCWKKRGPPNKRCYHTTEQAALPEIIKQVVELFQSDAMFLLLSNLTGLKLHELAGSSSEEEGSESEENGIVQGTSQTGDIENGDQSTLDDAKKTENSEINTEGGGNNESAVTTATEKGEKSELGKDTDKPCSSKCRLEVRRWSQGSYTLAHDTDTEGSEFALDLMFYAGCHDWQDDYGGFTCYIAKDEDEELLTVTPKENSLALVYRDKDAQRFVKYVNSSVKQMDNAGFYDISAVYFEK